MPPWPPGAISPLPTPSGAGVFSLLFTDLPVQPGDRGGGLFDAFGRLIGPNTWTHVGPNGPEGISLSCNILRSIAAAVRERGDVVEEISKLSEPGRHSPSRLFSCLRGLCPLPVAEVNSGPFTPGLGAPTPKRLRCRPNNGQPLR